MKSNQAQAQRQAEPPVADCSFLLRLWCAEQAEPMCWRVSLEDPRSGRRIGFDSLEQLFAFLMEETERHLIGVSGADTHRPDSSPLDAEQADRPC